MTLAVFTLLFASFPPLTSAAGGGVPDPDAALVGIGCTTDASDVVVDNIVSPKPNPEFVLCLDISTGLACDIAEVKAQTGLTVGINGGFVAEWEFSVESTLWTKVHCWGEVRGSGVFYGGVGLREGSLKIGKYTATCLYVAPLGACRTPELSVPFDATRISWLLAPDSQFHICQVYSYKNELLGLDPYPWAVNEGTQCDARNYKEIPQSSNALEATWGACELAFDAELCEDSIVPCPSPLECPDPWATLASLVGTADAVVGRILDTPECLKGGLSEASPQDHGLPHLAVECVS